MRIINIYVNGNLVSKKYDEIYDWLEYSLKNHLPFKIVWVNVEKRLKNV